MRPARESPLRLTAHGGFGEGDGETRPSQGWKVRPVPTLRSSGGEGDLSIDCNLGGALPQVM
jgi:hypothetical protein